MSRCGRRGPKQSAMKIINRRGQEIAELDDSDSNVVLDDGHGVRVSSYLMDSVQKAIASSAVASPTTHRITDSAGRAAGSRPGFCYDSNTNNEAQAQASHDAHKKYLADAYRSPADSPIGPYRAPTNNPAAPWPGQRTIGVPPDDPDLLGHGGWQGPGPYEKPADRTTSVSESRAAYVKRMENAWKPENYNEKWDRPDAAAWPGGGWSPNEDRAVNPKPKDVTIDARPAQDDVEKAREDYKARISNAWRSTKGIGLGPGSFGA